MEDTRSIVRAFFECGAVKRCLRGGLLNEFNNDHEFFNQFFSILSKQYPLLLVPYDYTLEPRITYKHKGLVADDLPDVKALLQNHKGRRLVLFVTLLASFESMGMYDTGVVEFDPIRKTQTIYCPSAHAGKKSPYTDLLKLPIVPELEYDCTAVLAPNLLNTACSIVEHVTEISDVDGVLCVLVGALTCYTGACLEQVGRGLNEMCADSSIQRGYWDWVEKTITWYQRGFIEADDDDPVPMPGATVPDDDDEYEDESGDEADSEDGIMETEDEGDEDEESDA